MLEIKFEYSRFRSWSEAPALEVLRENIKNQSLCQLQKNIVLFRVPKKYKKWREMSLQGGSVTFPAQGQKHKMFFFIAIILPDCS